jgi:hypothetical protein
MKIARVAMELALVLALVLVLALILGKDDYE